MKRTAIVCAVIMTTASAAVAAHNFSRIRELLHGYEEVPAVSTGAGVQFTARINRDETEIHTTTWPGGEIRSQLEVRR